MNMKKFLVNCYSAMIWNREKRRAVRQVFFPITTQPEPKPEPEPEPEPKPIPQKNILSEPEVVNFVTEMIRRVTPMCRLRNFEVHITEHCNLNCRGCNHFSPLAEKQFLSLDTFEKDFQRMASLTNSEVEFINLLGGEPLLHPELLSFFPIARKLFPNTRIQLVTNGILLQKQTEDFWQACETHKITICITNYPIEINRCFVEEKARMHCIDIIYWDAHEERKLSWFFPFDLSGKKDSQINFIKCHAANHCIFLREGKLFTCVIPPNVLHFNKFFNQNIEVCEKDFIDIYKAHSIDDVLSFLAKPIPFCRFCNVENRKYDLVWKTSSRCIEEWV